MQTFKVGESRLDGLTLYLEPCHGTVCCSCAPDAGFKPKGYHQSLTALRCEPWRTQVEPFATARAALVDALASFCARL